MPPDIVVTIFAIFVAFTVQSVLGFAAGLTSLPILLSVHPLPDAVAISTIFNLVFSAIQVPKTISLMDKQTLKSLIPANILGIAIGASVLSFGQPAILKKFLGAFILLFLFYKLRGKIVCNISKMWGNVLVCIGGFFAGLFTAGAPPIVIYFSNKYEDTPEVFRANLIGMLAISNFLRPVFLIFTGVLNWKIFSYSMPAFVAFALALYLGERAFKKLDKALFAKMVYVFLAFSGIAMLLK